MHVNILKLKHFQALRSMIAAHKACDDVYRDSYPGGAVILAERELERALAREAIHHLQHLMREARKDGSHG